MIVDRNKIPSENEFKFEPTALNTQITKSSDVYAMYVKHIKSYPVKVRNNGFSVEGFPDIEVQYGSVHPKGMELAQLEVSRPGESSEDYDFIGWYPSPISKILGPTTIEAQYNYTAYQTVTLLDKRIETFNANIDSIPSYRFIKCNKLKEVILPWKPGPLDTHNLVLLGVDVFKDSSIYTDKELDLLSDKKKMERGYIYVPEDMVRQYQTDEVYGWKDYSLSIAAISSKKEGG